MADRLQPIRDVSPPGDILAEALEERGIKGAELARRLGCTEKHVSQLVNGKVPLTTDMALQLEQVLGIPARLWNSLEFNFRSEQKQRELRSGYVAHAEWMRSFPIPAMRKAGYVARDLGQSVTDRVEALLQFFGVTTPEAWQTQWEHVTARFRKAKSFDPDRAVLVSWLRRGEIEAQQVACAAYSEEGLRGVLAELRGMTRLPPEKFQPKLVATCAAVGVAVTFIPSLPGLALSGATRWMGDKAVIHLSLRHRSDDQLWFSFFHEVCHVLEHKTAAIYLDGATHHDGDPEEVRANEFARDQLIDPQRYAAFLEAWDGTSVKAIEAFADREGIAPGIVVGRLQHEGRLAHTHGNSLKVRFSWDYEV